MHTQSTRTSTDLDLLSGMARHEDLWDAAINATRAYQDAWRFLGAGAINRAMHLRDEANLRLERAIGSTPAERHALWTLIAESARMDDVGADDDC